MNKEKSIKIQLLINSYKNLINNCELVVAEKLMKIEMSKEIINNLKELKKDD